ncbi:MAG TPA: hypothetical protein VMN99_08665 [Anaerolineales bacterium]|nr:hypothetical protein [Anaerolineales bacterium]
MKLLPWSWVLGMLSYIFLGVVRRSGFPGAGMFLGTPGVITFLLLLLSTGIGTVFGVMSWRRREGKTWWAIGAIVQNIVVLAGTLLLFAG